MDRRTFLKGAGLAGAALLGIQASIPASTTQAPMLARAADGQPNILVIIVDQMRYPLWFPRQEVLDTILPNLARLRQGAVSFSQHYTAANACTPARGCLLTGLYAHQTGCMLTILNAQTPDLHPGFPTWGTLLRRLGYQTYWYGKWHLSKTADMEPYGFSGSTYPSPDATPEQGLTQDSTFAQQFSEWLQALGDGGPWCTTVSFINPHDISGYFRFTDALQVTRTPPSIFTALPPNYETPDDLRAQNKPLFQSGLQDFAAINFGELPFAGTSFEAGWLKLLDLYLFLQGYVDVQIGRVLDALEANDAQASKTIIIFTADHGEYAGSHGLRGKSAAVYEEAIRVPLYVKDPTGQLTSNPDVERTQLTSSVDITPLLLTLATGSNEWRALSQYAHLAGRLDLAAILRDPAAQGRPYILHTADENFVGKIGIAPSSAPPGHVIGVRLPGAKLGIYSFWAPGTIEMVQQDQETECYDYRTQDGQLELTNVAAPNNVLYTKLYAALITTIIPNELRKPLPVYLLAAQYAAIKAYLGANQAKVYLPQMSW